MLQILSKTALKLMTSLLVRCNYVSLCFGGQSPTFDQLSVFREIKLKFGGGVNYGMLLSYFMLIVPYEMNLIKIKGCYAIFY